MSSIVRFLWPVPAPRSATGIIAWWERRRLGFNIVVGTTGLITLSVVFLFNLLPPTAHFSIPWVLPIVFGFMANVCYSLGWAIELLLHKVWGDDVKPVGPVLFRQGMLFAVGLTLLPVVFAGVGWVARVLRFIL